MVPMATAVRGTRAAAPAAGKARTAEVRAAARRTEAIVRVAAEPAEAEVQAKANPKEVAVRVEADLKEAALPAGMEVRTTAAVRKAIPAAVLRTAVPPERRKIARAAVRVERAAEKQRKQACKGRTAHGLLCRKDRMMRQYMV